jgi:hypothetical protein
MRVFPDEHLQPTPYCGAGARGGIFAPAARRRAGLRAFERQDSRDPQQLCPGERMFAVGEIGERRVPGA